MVRILVDIKNSGKDVILVSSGAIAVGRNAIGLHDRPDDLSVKQACAAIGQAKLMMVYQKIFFRVQPDGGTDSSDQRYHGKRRLPLQRPEYL